MTNPYHKLRLIASGPWLFRGKRGSYHDDGTIRRWFSPWQCCRSQFRGIGKLL